MFGWLAAIAVIVGILIGSVGVGGVLLIPALNVLAAMPIQEAMATALFTFVFTGIAATHLFQRRGSVDWKMCLPVCLGAAALGFPGAWLNSTLNSAQLTGALGGLIVGAGIYTLWARASARAELFHGRPRLQTGLLLAIGAVTGFGSGLTGVGGPALSVPMLVLSGFPALAAIGVSQVVQVLAAVSGTAGNLLHGSINFPVAASLTLFELGGVWLGVKMAHAVDAALLRRAVGVLCILVGGGLLARTLQ